MRSLRGYRPDCRRTGRCRGKGGIDIGNPIASTSPSQVERQNLTMRMHKRRSLGWRMASARSWRSTSQRSRCISCTTTSPASSTFSAWRLR